ncbi:LOW QUALITY PROTEIN: hypothetical protein HID58_037867, partial [Brassica napus]
RMLMAQLMFREETIESMRTGEHSQGKKKVLCQLAASSKGDIDTYMKNFLEGLVQASFTTLGRNYFSDRLGKIETEVTQLRKTLMMTELAGKSDQTSCPSTSKIDTCPSTSKKDTAPSKKKITTKRKRYTRVFGKLHEELFQDTFVKGFDPSHAKAKDSLDWLEPPKSLKMSAIRLYDQEIQLTGEENIDRCL